MHLIETEHFPDLQLPLRTRDNNEEDEEQSGCRLCGSQDQGVLQSPLHYFLQCSALARPRQNLLQVRNTLQRFIYLLKLNRYSWYT